MKESETEYEKGIELWQKRVKDVGCLIELWPNVTVLYPLG